MEKMNDPFADREGHGGERLPREEAFGDEDYRKQVEALAEVSRAIVSDLYLEDILKLIVMVTAELMGSKIVSIMLLDEKTGMLQTKATQAVSEAYLRKPPLPLGKGIAGLVAKENRPIQVLDVRKDPRYFNREIAERENLCSLLSVPMSVKKKVVGVLSCYTTTPHVFSEHEVNLLTALANQAAVAIENAQLMVRSRIIQEELETRKLVERAKDILSRNLGIDGERAYRLIQRRSMDTRKSMREIAEAIILADLGGD